MGSDLEAVCSFPASKCPSPATGTNAAMSTFYCPLSCPARDTPLQCFHFPGGQRIWASPKLCGQSKQRGQEEKRVKMSPKPPKVCPSIPQLAHSSCMLIQPGWQHREEPWAKTLLSTPCALWSTVLPPVQLRPASPMALVVSGLQWIAKLQPCGFLQLAGKFDAGFPYVRSLQGSPAQHGSSLQQHPASPMAGSPVLCHSPRPQHTSVGFGFSPFPPAKSCPISHPSAVHGDQRLK